MGSGQVIQLVAAILGVQVVLWILIILWLRSHVRSTAASLEAEFGSSGETAAQAPQSARYDGATMTYPKVRGLVVVALTNRRLIVRRILATGFDIPLDEIDEVREAGSFRGRTRGSSYVIVKTRPGAEIGLVVRDARAWVDSLTAAIRRR